MITTSVAEASVRITEIAWMGTQESQFGEWFELYNDADESVNLAGWKLYEDAGSQLVFTLTKSISAKGFLLVERTTSSSPDPVPGINDESGTFGGSGFSNSGEDLVLKDDKDTSIQTLSFASGWPAGDADTKQTMQWDGSKWVTAVATPKASGGGSDNPPVESQKSGGVAVSAPRVEPRIVFSVPQTIYTNISNEYSTKTFLEFGEAYNGIFLWNMGDGTTYKTSSPLSIKHIYKYPGKYTISFAYYRAYYDQKPYLYSSIEKTVSSPKIIFSVVKNKGFEFKNTDTVPSDLSGWVIVLPDQKSVELPPLTIIGAGNTIIMPFVTFGLDSFYTKAVIQTPEKVNIANDEAVIKENNNYVVYSDAPLIKSNSVFEDATASVVSINDSTTRENENQKSYSKIMIFGLLLLIIIILFVVIEKFKVREEE